MAFLRKNKKKKIKKSKKIKNGLERIDSETTLIEDSPPIERKNQNKDYKKMNDNQKSSKSKNIHQEKKKKKNQKTKKIKNTLDHTDSGITLILSSPTMERKKKKQSPTKIVESANKDCDTLYQLTNLKIGNEDQLLDDFLFQDYLERIKDYQAQLGNLINNNKLKKRIKTDAEHCLQRIKDLLVFVNNSIKIGTEKKNKGKLKKKKKVKKELNLQIPSEKKRRVSVNDSPKEKSKPQLDLLFPKIKRQDSSEMFDDFFTTRQRRYSGSRLIKD
ncbi:hypothetical protein M0813_05867 [Anaeramoeba flamelloides]|uniref:Uncharacterized protein n=1 Tax=Anaeramoeba flamelloides TaxID=1746091 RepID=A0ABQ8XFU3_9EUKA|nr:hypothetical protein M0813_05867 [Anaeramoeba flamelloides]